MKNRKKHEISRKARDDYTPMNNLVHCAVRRIVPNRNRKAMRSRKVIVIPKAKKVFQSHQKVLNNHKVHLNNLQNLPTNNLKALNNQKVKKETAAMMNQKAVKRV